MSNGNGRDTGLLAPAMIAVLSAQACSSLGDNAALITAIAVLKSHALATMVPALQASYIVPFILLAAFVGQIADAFPKNRVMLSSNLVKFSGALLLAWGISPLAAYAIIGFGDAMYSPAKYGILAQMFGPAVLVRANGMMEASTIIAGLAGAVLAGWLADYSLNAALAGVLVCYALAAAINLLIPRMRVEKPGAGFHPWNLLLTFWAAVHQLFKNESARFSLLGTSLFWGAGITLRLMLFAWVPVALMTTDNDTPANLMAVIAIGIVLGAAAAGAWITLKTVNRALLGCLALGPVIMTMVFVHSLLPAMLVMIAVGTCAGVFVVPLNALLQEHGYNTTGAGRALAVQNFSEKSAMMGFVTLYGATVHAHVPVLTASTSFGVLLLALGGVLTLSRLRRRLP